MNSRSLARLWQSAFVEIDEVWNALNVLAIGDSHLLFSLFEPRRDRIAPSEFRSEPVPDKQIAFIEAPSFFETPLQNLIVGAALFHPFAKIAIMHPQEIAAHTVGRFYGTEIFMIILVQLATGMQPDFVEHAREIQHAASHFSWAFRVRPHTRVIAVSLWSRNCRD